MKVLFKILIISLVFSANINAQSNPKRWSYSVESQFMLSGDMKTSFSTIFLGGRAQYRLKDFKNMSLNVSQGIHTDVAIRELRLILLDTQVGADFFEQKRFSPYLKLGGYYTNERLSVEVIEGVKSRSFSNAGFVGTAGIRLKPRKYVTPKLFVRSCFGSHASLGLALNIK
jgi:hypothetical protein